MFQQRMLFCFFFLCGALSLIPAEVIKDPTLCARMKCKVPTERKFKYEEGVSYFYQYSVDVIANLGKTQSSSPESSNNETTLHIDGTLVLYFKSLCEGYLKFHNVSITHNRSDYNSEYPDRADAEFRSTLQRFTLRFAFDDGRIYEVCPNKRDPAWAVNLKRGVLSLLQNSMERFDVDRKVEELDVNGICDTTYRLYEARKTQLIVKKTKNLATCTSAGKHLSVIQSNSYRNPLLGSKIQRRSLLRSTIDCEIAIDHKIYEKVVCKDVHRLEPLSSADDRSGVSTESVATLQLLQENKDAYFDEYDEEVENEEGEEFVNKGIVTTRTTLLYDHSKVTRTMRGELRTARNLLKDLCAFGSNPNELQPRFAETFTSFVHSARSLDYPSLSQLFARSSGALKDGKKHIIDALPYMGSNAAVNVMKDLIIKKYVNEVTMNNWITMFALIPRPDAGTIRALAPFMEFQHLIPDAQFVLSYSSVIHAFCRNHGADCAHLDEVVRFLDYLQEQIGKGCAPRFHSLADVKKTLETLKAIENMGLETESLLKELKGCIDDQGGFLPMEVRVAAINAHRRLPSCERTRDKYFLDYYRNFTLDSELRIASYLQVMRCPDYNVVKTVKHALKVEQVNQVGSFVWSHLKNLYSSSSPTRLEIQSLLTDRDLGTKFNSDMRKFSRNYEGSFFSEIYDFGANYQSNLIFSSKSYVPRTASFNFTVDLFGESINLFELSMRMEGLEYYAENFFGPNGPYSNEQVSNHFKNILRSLRSTSENEDYWRRVNRLPNIIDNNFDDPRLSFGFKIFGNELKYTMFNGDEAIRNVLADLNPWDKVKKLFSGQEVKYHNTLMFLDSSYVVPTTSGLPVRLDLTASAACKLKLSGLLNTSRLMSDTELELLANFNPSISVDIVGKMVIDAFYKSAGVKLRSSMSSSGSVQLHFNMKGARLLRLNVGLPSHKMEVFSLETQVSLVNTNGAETQERPLGLLVSEASQKTAKELIRSGSVISNTTCSWQALDRLIGLKMCVDYQVPNVRKNPNMYYFMLNGPTLFKVSLIKADPTAKSYLLEYKWERTEDKSVFKAAFDTPGSQVDREMSAMVSFDLKSQNVTVLLHSTGNSLIAKGIYKSTENETFLEVGFDINGTKHLDASIGYTTKKFTYGYTYSPRFYLDVNSERVLAISGVVRNAQKNNLSQCDIDLTFQTKKLWSKLVGYIVKRNVSLAGDFQLDYQFQTMSKKETLHLEIALANRSSKTLAYRSADLKLHSTAYPQLNTMVTAWYQQAFGHLELHAEINSSPHLRDDRHKLTAQLVISYSKMYFQNQGIKISALVAITKPIQNLDIRVGVNHYAVGVESKTSLLIGYAPGKEISLIVNMITPRGLLFAVEGHANLTIPNFNSMLIDARITERSRREYELDFAGTWFSGHNMVARGTYIDRSTSSSISHNLKMILKSPNFADDILLNCKLYYNMNDLKISIHVEQEDMEKYAFKLNHVTSFGRLMNYIETRYKGSVYSISTIVNAQQEIRIEIHVDKWRDVHLILISNNEENSKEFGIELKWDANRDPALKFATIFQMNKFDIPALTEDNLPGKNLTLGLTLTYPGRLITSSCLLATRDHNNYLADVAINWANDKTIRLSLDMGYSLQLWMKSLKLEFQLLTPFEQWKRTSFNAKYLQLQNKVIGSCSIYWKDTQKLIADFYMDAREYEKVEEWIGNCGLSSTVHSIEWVTMNVTHKLVRSQSAETRLLIKYHPDKVIDAWSIWQLNRQSDNVFNLTGNLHLESPLASYRKCDLKCQLHVMKDWKFQGATTMLLNKREYSGNLFGDLKRLRESAVRLSLTTPLEKYAFIRARFGLSESERQAVAEIVSPSGTFGFEVIFQLFTVAYDFNVKFLLATPLDVLQRFLLVAKLSKKEADFKIAYNNMTLGYQGIWHYNNFTDFQYTYILFTPLHGLHEIGAVAKLIAVSTEPDGTLDVDAEFSLRLAEIKLGARAKGGPKPPPVRIVIKKNIMLRNNDDVSSENEENEDEEDEEDYFYWHGELEIWLAIVEAISGELDIDSEGTNYNVIAFLQIPQGRITLDDYFFMEDVFHMKNELNIVTPFNVAKEINSLYVFDVNMEVPIYFTRVDVNVKNNHTWYKSGYSVNYTSEEREDDWKTHTVKVNLTTPLTFLKFIDTKVIVSFDENFYKTNVNIRGEWCVINFVGSIEAEEHFLDTMCLVRIDSPVLVVPKTTLTLKKDFTDKKKLFQFGATIENPTQKTTNVQASWQVEDANYIEVSVLCRTWMEILKEFEAQFLYVNTVQLNDSLQLSLNVTHNIDHRFQLVSDYKNGVVQADLRTPMELKKHFKFNGHLSKINDTLYTMNGELINLDISKIYEVSSDIALQKQALAHVQVNVKPKMETGNANAIVITLTKKRYELSIDADSRFFNATVGMNFINALNWDVRARGTDKERQESYELITFTNVQINGNASLYVHSITPWRDVQSLTLDGSMFLTNNSGDTRLNYLLNNDRYYALLQWKLQYIIDTFIKMIVGYEINNGPNKDVSAKLFFKKNPGGAFKNLDAGFDVDIDHEKWKLAANTTIGFRNHENVDAVLTVRLPPPNNDEHRLLLSYHANKGVQDLTYVIGYNALRAKTNYASDGSIRMAVKDIDGHLRLTWGLLANQSLNNLFNMTFDKQAVELKYSLFTPKILNEETVVVLLNYDGKSDQRSLIDVDLFYPARKRLGTAKISYASLSNVNGTVNASFPSLKESYAGCHFVVFTTLKQNKRFVEVFWSNETALLNSDYSYHSEKLDSNLEGVFQLEIPLNTRHVGHLTYGYKKRPQVTTGYSMLMYNTQRIFHAEYISKSESRAGFEKDRIQINVENVFTPIGIVYTNQYEYSGGNEGTNYPTMEIKQVNVYRLGNSSAFNVAGESRVRTTHTGQDIYLKAVHSNRTVQFKTNYQVLSGEFDQNAWLSLASDAWISYHINILNKTTEEVDNQFLIVNLAYPKRNFTLDASYKISSDELDSKAKLEWDQMKEHPRTIGASFNWKNITSAKMLQQQQAVLSLHHPSFVKEVSLKGEMLRRDVRDLLNVALIVDYSYDPDKLLELSALLKDESNLPTDRRYVYNITGRHPRTQFDLNVEGVFHKYQNTLVEIDNHGKYKRSFLPEEIGQLTGRLDLVQQEIFLHRQNNDAVKHFDLKYHSNYPQYKMNGSAINTPELNATGAFFLDIQEKLIWTMVNYTPDAIESLRMYGRIPDARNAVFDIWRTYDNDLNVYDVSFYIKLNHSRLVTSTLKWRPELKNDIIFILKSSATNMYESINKDTDYWKQYIKSETVSVISDVWEDAQEELKEFVDDWNDLKNLEEDFDDLKVYLNNSYNANDFYIKDISNFIVYMIDELSLRSHIQSLPNIFNEIWEIMGESGEALRNSLLWIIETIKNAYRKITEIVTAVLRGDSVSQVASTIEKLIEKYDMFIKDLHVSFIKYIANLWDKIWLSISQQWHKFLKLVEPLFIRMLHYLETVAWKASKEVLDFLYDRKNELISSPYFDRFANFTQDIDKFYRDIKANDIVTNIHKYSAVVIQFLKERYFTFVPFGKELKDVIDEILSELKELKKLPSVHYTLEKMQQLYDRAAYLYEYFDVKSKIENAIRLIHSRLMDISQTALQAENRYREAKTKLIFDPNEGILCLEQKLPMSWHAFNQTPEFQEIPEYRAIADMGSYFSTSNTTFWTLYYRYKPYIEPSNWLPPFKAQAMITGSRYYRTFDGLHFDFTGSCTYLLAHDFVRNTFAILIKYEKEENTITHKIIVLMGKDAIEIDVFNDLVKLISNTSPNSTSNLPLPTELDNSTTYVYQEENIVIVERKPEQLRLECNLKFDLCTLELSGWYYGKTAGLLGTMDNEKMNDLTASNGRITDNVKNFARSWSINDENDCPDDDTNPPTVLEQSKEVDERVTTFCDELFSNSTSEFSSCFSLLDPAEYAEMCLKASTESEACTIAMSYMHVCIFHDTYLRIPDRCTTCTMINGSQIAEGEFKKLEGSAVPRSSDIVFIVEAKECNRGVKQNRSIEQLVNQLSKEFTDHGLTSNHWSLVTFGGDGVHSRPRSVILDGQVFTKNIVRFVDYFDRIPVGNGSQDIFAAIGYASQLVFRPGVSKTFILLPCSHCEPENQVLDYAVVHQVLLEHDIVLHVLMDGDFQFEKERLNKIFYGLDANRSYTKKDSRSLNGDMDLRKQVKLSKSVLGYCWPLSLETNGTIFSGDKLRFDKLVTIKKFVSVFAKRVAQSAQPRLCQHCECTADNNGATKTECMPCVYPTPVTVDYEAFNVNETLMALQPLDIDYGQIDIEED